MLRQGCMAYQYIPVGSWVMWSRNSIVTRPTIIGIGIGTGTAAAAAASVE